jgi:hypothetical protein
MMVARRRRPREPVQVTYIEEPEAHLFPSAQSVLMEALVSIVMGSQTHTRLVLTTHSPYVLAKLNNLALAGIISTTTPSRSRAVKKVVPEAAQLKPGSIKAYAIRDRKLSMIMDENGLIDATYLDSVSADISKEFDALLAIESGDDDTR